MSTAYTNLVIKLEERFYVDEQGFKFVVRTGIDLTDLIAGEIMGVLKRPNGTLVKRVIPLIDIQNVTGGVVLFGVEDGDLTVKGEYQGQVFTRDASKGTARPSHIFTFVVQDAVVPDIENIFV